MSERTRNEILEEYIETLAKVGKHHPGYARRLMKLMQELLHTPPSFSLSTNASDKKDTKEAKQ